jgi:hypothetical protein
MAAIRNFEFTQTEIHVGVYIVLNLHLPSSQRKKMNDNYHTDRRTCRLEFYTTGNNDVRFPLRTLC